MKIFFKSVRFAVQGLRWALQGRNFRIQCVVAFFVVVFGITVGLGAFEWVIILLLIGLVLSMETMNSAIENLVNMISPEYHPLAGRIKDLAAGAVLIVAIVAAVIGIIIFSKYVMSFS
ncbi:MAG TPA: diacylglycerol kinase family protein [Ohtaekwangia sp.]|nr:diacylglycerol kinase family protein [Ohtaekwangia sp.]